MVKKTNEDGSEIDIEETEYEKIFENSKTYVHLKI